MIKTHHDMYLRGTTIEVVRYLEVGCCTPLFQI